MKRLALMAAASLLSVAVVSSPASAQSRTNVKSYVKKDGTYVSAHQRTAPNVTRNDNWSTRGNVNPNTGKAGTKPGGYNSTRAYKPYRPK